MRGGAILVEYKPMTINGFVMVVTVAANAAVLALGGIIAGLAYRAYRRTGLISMRRVTAGFGLVTLGLVANGVFHLLTDTAVTGTLTGVTLGGIGLGLLAYSLYTTDYGTVVARDGKA